TPAIVSAREIPLTALMRRRQYGAPTGNQRNRPMKHINVSALLFAIFCVAFNGRAHAQNPPLPVIPTNTVLVTKFGAVGDGKTMNTTAIQKTIDAASAAGGGIVLVPEG